MSDETASVANSPRLVGVRCESGGGVRPYSCGALELQPGDQVVVETERGSALGTVVRSDLLRPVEAGAKLGRVIKKADGRDLAREDANLRRQREAQRIALHRIRERGLAMKLISVECSFDGGKISFYFCAEGRVDFRDLVRDLAHTLHTRIEMKQIGARDETRFIGGIAACGRELCCASWLTEFEAISVKMAKDQGLSLNPTKLAGMCGRLKCCLRFEYLTYRELGRRLPAIGSAVACVKGDGVVTHQDVLKQTVKIRHQDGSETEASLEELVERKAQP
ncbi:MAG: stage 0 sporulation protein [Deltaproteobacteria bacterium]|nr:stage 0 sporulation protein [Deltaproteobacteria bacterium]